MFYGVLCDVGVDNDVDDGDDDDDNNDDVVGVTAGNRLRRGEQLRGSRHPDAHPRCRLLLEADLGHSGSLLVGDEARRYIIQCTGYW